jgi:hypothetical protein
MDIRTCLQAVAPVSSRQFAVFRIVFGIYLATHFAYLIPWGPELFSRTGMLSDAAINPTFGILPNVLVWWDTPGAVTVFLVVMLVGAVLFTLGVARQFVAIVLWYGWACLFNRNVLISNPSIPYIGLLLLLSALVPATEAWSCGARSTAHKVFYVPAVVFIAAWILMSVGYTFSGVIKLSSPSWIDGSALGHVLNNPLARTGWARDLLLGLPVVVVSVLTWASLALEIFFLPLVIWSVTRPWVWLAMIVLHVSLMLVVSFADLSIGMLMLHLFTFDRRWVYKVRPIFVGSRLA